MTDSEWKQLLATWQAPAPEAGLDRMVRASWRRSQQRRSWRQVAIAAAFIVLAFAATLIFPSRETPRSLPSRVVTNTDLSGFVPIGQTKVFIERRKDRKP